MQSAELEWPFEEVKYNKGHLVLYFDLIIEGISG